MKKVIYLDNAATTCVDKSVVREMEGYYLKEYGNPGSLHEMGERARKAIDNIREEIAKEIGARAEEIIFTSGTTEGNNLAFFGLARSPLGKKKKKIIISAIEHSSIFDICTALNKEGFEICEIGVDREGIVDIKKLEREINENTLLVSIMHVNNEIGVVQEIDKIGKICRDKGVLFHTDAAQSFGKMQTDVKKMNIGLLSAGAQKIGGPKGIGFLFIKAGIEIEPLIYGGQERGLRGGTENVPGIIGIGKALEIIKKIDKEKIRKMRDYFISGLEKLGGKINGTKEQRIYDNINISFKRVDGEGLVFKLSAKGIYVSTGSACDTKKQKESKVLKEIGLNEEEIKGAIRIGIGKEITKKEVDFVLSVLQKLQKT